MYPKLAANRSPTHSHWSWQDEAIAVSAQCVAVIHIETRANIPCCFEVSHLVTSIRMVKRDDTFPLMFLNFGYCRSEPS